MSLLPRDERRRVLRKSQSLRWIGVGFALTVAETMAQAVGEQLIPGPAWVKSLVIGLILAGAWGARFLAARED